MTFIQQALRIVLLGVCVAFVPAMLTACGEKTDTGTAAVLPEKIEFREGFQAVEVIAGSEEDGIKSDQSVDPGELSPIEENPELAAAKSCLKLNQVCGRYQNGVWVSFGTCCTGLTCQSDLNGIFRCLR